jgi:hypothetical protein
VGEHVLLLVALGAWHFQQFNAGLDVSEERLRDARQNFDLALALNADCPQAHAMIGWMDISRGRVLDGTRSLHRALRTDPHHTHALALLSVVLWVTGRRVELRDVVTRLRAIDPFDFYGLLIDGFHQSLEGHRERRDALMTEAFAVSSSPAALFFHGLVCAQDGEFGAARALWQRPELGEQDDLFTWLSRAGVEAIDGNPEAARALNESAVMQSLAAHDAQWGWHLCEILALAGLVNDALNGLDQAVQNGFSNIEMMASRDAMFASIRSHERFPSILAHAARRDAELAQTLHDVARGN